MKNVTDFVNIHNEYVVIKGNEEKAKVIYYFSDSFLVPSQETEA
jgi:glycogen synthase